jgi:hypothetical protein
MTQMDDNFGDQNRSLLQIKKELADLLALLSAKYAEAEAALQQAQDVAVTEQEGGDASFAPQTVPEFTEPDLIQQKDPAFGNEVQAFEDDIAEAEPTDISREGVPNDLPDVSFSEPARPSVADHFEPVSLGFDDSAIQPATKDDLDLILDPPAEPSSEIDTEIPEPESTRKHLEDTYAPRLDDEIRHHEVIADMLVRHQLRLRSISNKITQSANL